MQHTLGMMWIRIPSYYVNPHGFMQMMSLNLLGVNNDIYVSHTMNSQ